MVPDLVGGAKVAYELKRLKDSLKSWSREQRDQRRRRQVEIESEVDMLDKKEEETILSAVERASIGDLKEEWASLQREEESKWRQRPREVWIKEGDNNTKFFHKSANQRRRLNHISRLRIGDDVLESPSAIEQSMVVHFTRAYSKNWRWSPDWADEDLGRVPDDRWADLEAPFSENEVKAAVFGSKADKAPGPDGFGLRFYQEFWLVVQEDVKEMFFEFQMGNQGIGRLNSTFLVLIPKKEGATEVADFKPISLVNGAYKMIAKALVNRLKTVTGSMVEENQTAFILGRLFQDGYLAIQECIAAAHKEKRKGVVLKIDFSKAYDNIPWDLDTSFSSLQSMWEAGRKGN